MQRRKLVQVSIFVIRKQNFSSFIKPLTNFHLPTFHNEDPLYTDIPKPRKDKSERKPYPTPMKELIRRAKEEKQLRNSQPCRVLEHPPDNGLLVPELVPVAHSVHKCRNSLLSGISKIIRHVHVHQCRYCSEVHIGQEGHELRTCTGPGSGSRSGTHVWKRGRASDVVFFPKCYHLYDRAVKPRVLHDERFNVPRISAVLELCIQAGVDLEKFPSKRRSKPVYSIEGRIVDFEEVNSDTAITSTTILLQEDDRCNSEKKELSIEAGVDFEKFPSKLRPKPVYSIEGRIVDFEEVNSDTATTTSTTTFLQEDDNLYNSSLKELSIETMESWFEMVLGVKKLMERYKVWTCGYCPEIQVGPKGHKVRNCKATKHQMRDGMHAWQEATIDDIVGPNYVWHVRDGSVLDNSLKRFYGKAPAVVEMCVQSGAPVPDQYKSMMRLDVVYPQPDEVDLVA